ncbi:MAG: DUF1189 family protein [Deltaproteobacteria bacterium]|nr:DUF1189 family protein [Deltaproteobacteria bacterium]
MKKYSLLHPPVLSFFSKDLYRDVGQNWRGIAALYLVLLLAFCWIFETWAVNEKVSQFIINEAPPFVEQIPEITIQDGNVSINEPEPYFLYDPETGDVIAIIDTTGFYDSLDNTEAYLLLTNNKFIVRKSEAERRVYDLSQMDEFFLDQNTINNFIDIFKTYFPFVFYVFAVIFSFVFRLVLVLIYGAIGFLFCKIANVKLTYQTLIRLAVIASTPVIILDTVLEVSNVNIPFFWLICFAIVMCYLYFGVWANKAQSTPRRAL